MTLDRLYYDEGDGSVAVKEYIIVDDTGKTALLTVPTYFTNEHVHELLDGSYTIAVEPC